MKDFNVTFGGVGTYAGSGFLGGSLKPPGISLLKSMRDFQPSQAVVDGFGLSFSFSFSFSEGSTGSYGFIGATGTSVGGGFGSSFFIKFTVKEISFTMLSKVAVNFRLKEEPGRLARSAFISTVRFSE